MLEAFVDLVMERRRADPGMHVYHYGGYESGALKRLMQRHATREDEIDVLLRGHVLVNLYDHVVRQGIRASVESYSIKKLETFYMPEREGGITQRRLLGRRVRALDGGAATRRSSTPSPPTTATTASPTCCSATGSRRAATRRSRRTPSGIPTARCPGPAWEDGEPDEKVREAILEVRRREDALREGVPGRPARSATPEQQGRWLLAALLDWHRREAKPQWWDHFRLVEAPDGGPVARRLRARRAAVRRATWRRIERSAIHRYALRPGAGRQDRRGQGVPRARPRTPTAAAGTTSAVTVVALDPLDRDDRPQAQRAAAAPGRADPDEAVRRPSRCAAALLRLADHVDRARDRRAGAVPGGARPGPAAAARGSRPGRRATPLAPDGADADAGRARSSALRLDETVLAIQGPPGTGKTYTAARMILDLVEAGQPGRRDGAVAPGHREPARGGRGGGRRGGARCVRIGQRIDGDDERPATRRHRADPEDRRRSPGGLAARTVGRRRRHVAGCGRGTTWRERVDVLFVDEAGQVSLATVCSVAGAARSVVLLGDPNQLPQVSQGTHPEGAEASALEHLVGEAKTIPPDRGLLLGTTYRLHPDVNAFISDAFYEGRLATAPGNERQRRRRRRCRSAARGSGTSPIARPGRGQPVARRRRRWIADAVAGARRPPLDRRRRAGARPLDVGRRARSSRPTTPRSRRSSGPSRSGSASMPTSGPSTSSRAARRRSRSTR